MFDCDGHLRVNGVTVLLPFPSAGDAGKFDVVNSDGTGYELVAPLIGGGGSTPPDPLPPPNPPAPDNVLTVALAAAQHGVDGRRIDALTIDDGLLRPGYGSLTDNAGPIHALALDLGNVGAGLVDEATLHTEQIGRYVPSSIELLCPFIDPRQGIGNPEEGSYAVLIDGVWVTRSIDTPYAVHVLDMAESQGELHASGSSLLPDGGQSNGQV